MAITIFNEVVAAQVVIKNTCYRYVISYLRIKLLPIVLATYSLLTIGFVCLESSSVLS